MNIEYNLWKEDNISYTVLPNTLEHNHLYFSVVKWNVKIKRIIKNIL